MRCTTHQCWSGKSSAGRAGSCLTITALRRFHIQPLARHALSAWMNSFRPTFKSRMQSAAAKFGIVSYERSVDIRS